MNSIEDKATLIDRLGIGLLSAVSVFLTMLPIIFIYHFSSVGLLPLWFPLKEITILTFVFFLLGFFTLDNYVIKILSPIWKLLEKLFKGLLNGL